MGSFASWPLAGTHHRLCLHASSALFSRKVLHLSIQKEERGNIWDGGGSSQCRRGLANPCRFVGWCAGNDYLLYTRLLTLFLK
jgi:hypothetical protein